MASDNFDPHLLQITKHFICGYMSVDAERKYSSDLSQLLFLNSIPKGKLSFDLNHNISQAVKRTTDDNGEKIDLLLKFVLDQDYRMPNPHENLMFITYRRTLSSIMCSPFCNDPLRIVACLLDGAIYLYSPENPKKTESRKSRTKQEERLCAWGYKFEQYMLSDSPSVKPNIDRPVIENKEFSLFYHGVLDQHRLLYGAQTDGMLATGEGVENPPNTTDVPVNLNYLKKNMFVELKTNKEIQNRRDVQNFKKNTLLRSWCQCYLAGLEGLLVGFRNDEGVIQRLKWFDTNEIFKYCKEEWSPHMALDTLNYFLSCIKKCFYNQVEEIYGENCDIRHIGPMTYQFELGVDKTIRVVKVDETDKILPDWFVMAKRE